MTIEELVPEGVLYKYRDCGDNSWKILELQKIWFSHPLSFNDPFDCSFSLRYDKLTEEELEVKVREFVKWKYIFDGYFLKEKRIKDIMVQAKLPNALYDAQDAWNKNIIDKIGVFCACPQKDNILLWSHYSRDHKGFAIGFHAKSIEQAYQSNKGILGGKVKYENEYPFIMPPEPGNTQERIDSLIKLVYIKAISWEYEQEIRFVNYNGERGCSFESDAIKEIIIGCKMERKCEEKLMGIIASKYPDTEVYKAKMSREAFELEFDRIR